VKTLRLCLLVMLALLIPIRGALATAMLCPPMVAAGHMHAAIDAHHPALQLGTPAHLHDHGQGLHHDAHETAKSSDKCNLCAACCSVTPMLSSLPTVAIPPQFSTVTFTALTAPPPSFESGGQDRPPRTI